MTPDNTPPKSDVPKRRFAMLLQDPFVPLPVKPHEFDLGRDYLLGNGSSRFVVQDQDAYGNLLYSGGDWSSEAGTYTPFQESAGNSPTQAMNSPQFHQVNVFAVCNHTLEFVEQEIGREIMWSHGRPLILRPHAFEDANAYYEPNDVSLNFGYFYSLFRDRPVWLCLSHDVIAHELGHAILDHFRPLWGYAIGPDTHAFHESFADILAMLSALEHKEVVDALFGEQELVDVDAPNLISDLAEEFGAGLGGSMAAYLRSALNVVEYRSDLSDEPHARSEVWTGAIYDVLRELAILDSNSSDRKVPKKSIVESADRLKGLILRTMNFLPPTGVTFPALARLTLVADELAFGNAADKQTVKVRRTVAGSFTKRGLLEFKAIKSSSFKIDLDSLKAIYAGIEDQDFGKCLLRWVATNALALKVPDDGLVTLLMPTFATTIRKTDTVKNAEDKCTLILKEHYLQYAYSTVVEIDDERFELFVGYTLVISESEEGMWSVSLLVGEDELWNFTSDEHFCFYQYKSSITNSDDIRQRASQKIRGLLIDRSEKWVLREMVDDLRELSATKGAVVQLVNDGWSATHSGNLRRRRRSGYSGPIRRKPKPRQGASGLGVYNDTPTLECGVPTFPFILEATGSGSLRLCRRFIDIHEKRRKK